MWQESPLKTIGVQVCRKKNKEITVYNIFGGDFNLHTKFLYATYYVVSQKVGNSNL